VLKLHAAYRERKLFLWGQITPVRIDGQRGLPFAAKRDRLRHAIFQVVGESPPVTYRDAIIWVPTCDGEAIDRGGGPAQSTALRPWRLPVAILNAHQAGYFLDSCNRNPGAESPEVKIASTARFWGAAFRFAAALAARERIMPSLEARGESFRAVWLPLLSAPDHWRLRELAGSMPPPARSVTLDSSRGGQPPEDDPARMVADFVEWTIDAIARQAYQPERPVSQPRAIDESHLTALWVNRLCSSESQLPGDRKLLASFCDRVKNWQRPVLRETQFPWLIGFQLLEPEEAAETDAWHVHYGLQPVGGGATVAIDRGAMSRGSLRYVDRLLANAASICADVRAGSDSFPLDVMGAFRFLTDTAPALADEGFGVEVPVWWKRRDRAAVRARPLLKPARASQSATFSLDDLMQFDWEVAIGGETCTREELDRLAASTAPLVKIRGRWLPLDPQSVRAALELWKREPVPAREAIRSVLTGIEAPPGIELEETSADGWIGELIEKLGGKARFEELPVPADFRGTLRPYQVRGFSWLSFLRQYGLGACLADDMGLGKTPQALTLLLRERANGVDRPTLLVCPTSVVGNWRKEAARFTPGLSVLVHHGLARRRGPEFVEEAARHALVISSYSLVHRDLDVLRGVPWSGIILDEAQNIKNPETQQSRAARSLDADYRIALTGTPVENNVGELWAIMEFLNPGFLGTAAEFRRSFLLPIQRGADGECAGKLRKLTAPFILRRLKTDRTVLQDLPEKNEMRVYCNLTPEQASLYKSVVHEVGAALDDATGIQRKGVILAALTKLKQVCNHPAQFLGDQSPLAGRSGKLERLTEMVEELLSEGDRALIFSQFAEMGERLRSHLAAAFGQEVLLLHGGVPAHKRNEMVERFQRGGDGPRLFVLSLKAGGTGLNLTAANHVFHFDRWWNPAVEDQATDRAFRIGQRRDVQVHKFVCVGTLEEKIDEMIERKKAIADTVIGTGEAWLTELSTTEIKELMSLREEALA